MLVRGKKKNILAAILLFILLVGWCALIFNFSTATREESSSLSGGILRSILERFSAEFREADSARQEEMFESVHEIFRKCAHFFEYFVLEIIAFLFFSAVLSGKLRASLQSMLFVICYSCTDEIHQYFVPGRGCKIFDVLVDSLGGLLALGVILIVSLFIRHAASRKTKGRKGVKNAKARKAYQI